jgi:hypothetical protein
MTTFLDLLFIAIVGLTMSFFADYARERACRSPGSARSRVRDVGRDADRRVGGPAGLFSASSCGAPGYILASYHKSDGTAPRARSSTSCRLVLERDLPVRPRVRVGPHRHDQHRRRRRGA